MICLFKIRFFITPLLFLLLLCIGCGPYSFSGTANPHLKTVAVPIFEDQTAEFGIKEELTNAIIDQFTQDNTLKIADRRNADSIINGTLLNVNEQAGVYDANDVVQEIRLFVTVRIKYEDVKKRKVLWEEQMRQFGTYSPIGGADSGDRQSAITEAVEKIAREVINKSVSGW